MKILVVDDEKLLVKGIKFNLENEGYEVLTGADGVEAVEIAASEAVDLVVLDLMMPRMDGLQACQKIREFSDVPIIMLTAKADDMDKLLGFEHGADDYLTKPFNILELKARIRALLRRSGGKKEEKSPRLICENITLDTDARNAYNDGVLTDLTAKEFDLLVVFLKNQDIALYRETLYERVWHDPFTGDTRTVDLHVQRLRRKLGLEGRLIAVYKVGYRFLKEENSL